MNDVLYMLNLFLICVYVPFLWCLFITQHFGEITKNELDVSVPLLTISFATRLHAEQAMTRGRVFKEKPLQVRFIDCKRRQSLIIKKINK